MDPNMIYDLIQEYNANPQRYSDEEAEVIATLSQAIGADFQRESKAGRKGLFDLLDTAALGMVPNEWRPTSRGESVYGETTRERFAGGAGSLLGLLGGGALAYKGARGLMRSGAADKIRSGAAETYRRASSAAPRAYDRTRAIGSTIAGEGRDQTARALSRLQRLMRDMDPTRGIGNVGFY